MPVLNCHVPRLLSWRVKSPLKMSADSTGAGAAVSVAFWAIADIADVSAAAATVQASVSLTPPRNFVIV